MHQKINVQPWPRRGCSLGGASRAEFAVAVVLSIVGGAGERQARVDTSFISATHILALSIPNRSKHVTEISRCVVIGRLFFPKFHSGFR